ncbi:formaldehyde-activating enzyme [Methanoculleus chikugoensis]|uniref:Formaldehyde-activating enzyme domain-containing protein n=1 Tax=Methanoculleus chikugoensis TaxID=118126 RepID=A0ABN5XGG8_9EURY|nr:formaldehyde-activating enzyme [Methanoculleus chikugoensis]BBL67917.1 hypothetical protein MchiMG62_10980 [Methanoculleus chikugoensis]
MTMDDLCRPDGVPCGPAAVAKAVVDSVAESSRRLRPNLLIIASVFIEWDAADKKKIYDWNYEATKTAIRRTVAGEPGMSEVLARKDTAKHPFA